MRRPRRHRGWWIALTVIVVLLLAIRFIGSPIATSMLNRKLAGLDGYDGHVDSVRLAVWRGAVQVHDLVLRSKEHADDPPLLSLHNATLRVAPLALFKGKLGGAAVIDGVDLTLVKHEQNNPDEAKQKLGEKLEAAKEQTQHWQEVLRNAMPVTLSKLEVTRGRIHYIDRSHQPVVDVALTNLHLLVTDLQNRPKANGDPMPAHLRLDGVLTGNGQVHSAVKLDPVAKQPLFAGSFEIRHLDLPPFNSFLLAYTNADVSRGSFELYSEIEAKGGAYDGYVKPLFHDLDFRTASDEHKSAGQLLAKKVVSTVASVLKNDDKQQVATKAPFRGNFADNRVDIWTTIAELFHNAFVQALRGGFEGQTPKR